jgi:hypothetical protein
LINDVIIFSDVSFIPILIVSCDIVQISEEIIKNYWAQPSESFAGRIGSGAGGTAADKSKMSRAPSSTSSSASASSSASSSSLS